MRVQVQCTLESKLHLKKKLMRIGASHFEKCIAPEKSLRIT